MYALTVWLPNFFSGFFFKRSKRVDTSPRWSLWQQHPGCLRFFLRHPGSSRTFWACGPWWTTSCSFLTPWQNTPFADTSNVSCKWVSSHTFKNQFFPSLFVKTRNFLRCAINVNHDEQQSNIIQHSERPISEQAISEFHKMRPFSECHQNPNDQSSNATNPRK
jgi:hypothetical protein